MKGKSNQPQATSSTATCRHRRRRHKTSEYNMKGNEDVTLFKRETETQYGNETQYREKPINIIYKLTCRQPCSGRNYTAQYFIRMYPSMAVFKSKLRDLITTIMFTSSNDHLTPRMVESMQHMQQPFHADTIDFSVPSWTFVVWFLCFTGTHSRSTQYWLIVIVCLNNGTEKSCLSTRGLLHVVYYRLDHTRSHVVIWACNHAFSCKTITHLGLQYRLRRWPR